MLTPSLGPVSITNYCPKPLLCPLLWSHLTDHLMKQYKVIDIKHSRDLLGVRKREKAGLNRAPLYNCNKISVSSLRSSGGKTAFRSSPPQAKMARPLRYILVYPLARAQRKDEKILQKLSPGGCQLATRLRAGQ